MPSEKKKQMDESMNQQLLTAQKNNITIPVSDYDDRIPPKSNCQSTSAILPHKSSRTR
ncbi:MAG TPA: hypothetical protein VKR53_13350 [Puia sp.]|nr:hypothetical protein [Puia sp.]